MNVKLVAVGAAVILAAALVWAVEFGKPTQCNESACKPTWATDCGCGSGQKMEVRPDGTVLCLCPAR